LQPGADDYAAAFGDQLEALHGFADEVLGGVAGVLDVVHAKKCEG